MTFKIFTGRLALAELLTLESVLRGTDEFEGTQAIVFQRQVVGPPMRLLVLSRVGKAGPLAWRSPMFAAVNDLGPSSTSDALERLGLRSSVSI